MFFLVLVLVVLAAFLAGLVVFFIDRFLRYLKSSAFLTFYNSFLTIIEFYFDVGPANSKTQNMRKQAPCGRKLLSHTTRSPSSTLQWKLVLADFLKKKGLRSTQQRDLVAEIALSQTSHFEIQELIREVQIKHKNKNISPATVYRSVKILCEAGILNETLTGQSGVALYEAKEDDHHDHIVCVDCGGIFEFHDERLEAAQVSAIAALGFKEARHKHVIYAHCSLLKT